MGSIVGALMIGLFLMGLEFSQQLIRPRGHHHFGHEMIARARR
jgi:hypothetical protein